VDLATSAATLSIASTTTGISSPRTVALSGTGVPAGVDHAPTLPAATVSPARAMPGATVALAVDVRDLESALPGTDAIASVTVDLTRAGGGAAVPLTAGAIVAFADVASGAANIFDPGNLINAGAGFVPGAAGNLSADPLFVAGPFDDYYLAQLAGEAPMDAVSPCVDRAGAGTTAALGVAGRTTRSDHAPDADPADLGYHRKP